MSAQPKRRLATVLLASTLVAGGVLGAMPASATASAPAVLDAPPGAALDWIEGELAADGGRLTSSFDDGSGTVTSFDDWGLTIDATLALAAAGRGAGPAATTADGLVEDNVASYVTGGEFGPSDRYAGALAKTLLMAQIQGEDPTAFGGFHLVDELLARLQSAGPDAGRFSDQSAFGDFSNGFGQALAIIGLARTPSGVPDAAVAFLLAQQCPGGSFRGDYTTPGGCTDDTAATVDATAFALQALMTVEPTCAVRQAFQEGVGSLVAFQSASGAFGGESGSNTNSTGLAAAVLHRLGADPFLPVDTAASNAAAFVTSLQLEDGEDVGAIALNQAGFDSAADGVQPLERDGFRRATTQAVLAFGLPTYGEIGRDPIDPSTLQGCVGEEPPAPPTATLSAATVAPGGQLTVSGTGFTPGEPVAATLHSTPIDLGSTSADARGRVSLTFTVPADVEPGDHRVELVGQQSGVRVAAAVEVLGVEVPRTLPATGRTTGPQAGTGAGLILLGVALVGLARRRAGVAGRPSRHVAARH